jgi:hypothetical protein
MSRRCNRLFGLVFAATRLWRGPLDAFADKAGVERATTPARGRNFQSTTGYGGCCGLQLYAERAGTKPIVLARSPFQEGDGLAATGSVDHLLRLATGLPCDAACPPMQHGDGPWVPGKACHAGEDAVACAPK